MTPYAFYLLYARRPKAPDTRADKRRTYRRNWMREKRMRSEKPHPAMLRCYTPVTDGDTRQPSAQQ